MENRHQSLRITLPSPFSASQDPEFCPVEWAERSLASTQARDRFSTQEHETPGNLRIQIQPFTSSALPGAHGCSRDPRARERAHLRQPDPALQLTQREEPAVPRQTDSGWSSRKVGQGRGQEYRATWITKVFLEAALEPKAGTLRVQRGDAQTAGEQPSGPLISLGEAAAEDHVSSFQERRGTVLRPPWSFRGRIAPPGLFSSVFTEERRIAPRLSAADAKDTCAGKRSQTPPGSIRLRREHVRAPGVLPEVTF
ncbi:unnamed protein product [Rangifer tarandus platyrhynchus]|uniref:Uncharacterized protein n=2 Tax=Rangifer tarandus platyrhynchus TaxID=3082113 RepID=A0ABN8YZA4_RANTA|nr:unnamed protein product [Rangifer tarandus platyrhynchus]CAI9693692.1 unnamed protein product [Rangifer tarandus platyrhynchus]